MKYLINKIIGAIFAVLLISQVIVNVQAAENNNNDMCSTYKKRLQIYQKDGIFKSNPKTGKIEKADDKETRKIIQNLKEIITIFCS